MDFASDNDKKNVSLFRKVQTSSGPRHFLFNGYQVKWPESKPDHLPPFSNDVKSECSYNSAPPLRLLCMFRYKIMLLDKIE
jgi:hypothetical protein